MNIALYISPTEKAKKAAYDIIDFLKKNYCNIFIPEDTIQGFETDASYVSIGEIGKKCRTILCLGGDGTFLRSAEIAIAHEMNLFGFNLGRLGFLTGSAIENYEKVLSKIIKGDYATKERLILECTVTNGTETIFKGKALNEVTIFRSNNDMRLLDLSFTISGIYAGIYRADGLVIASPTGSTAYSLSAGGPIVSPDVECLLLTALYPHTLSARPLIISPLEVVEVIENNGKEISISLDGHFNKIVNRDTKIAVKKSDKGLNIISFEDDFYTIVRNKLGWVI